MLISSSSHLIAYQWISTFHCLSRNCPFWHWRYWLWRQLLLSVIYDVNKMADLDKSWYILSSKPSKYVTTLCTINKTYVQGKCCKQATRCDLTKDRIQILCKFPPWKYILTSRLQVQKSCTVIRWKLGRTHLQPLDTWILIGPYTDWEHLCIVSHASFPVLNDKEQ